MRRWLIIMFAASLWLALYGCVAEVRPDGYYDRGYYYEYPRHRYYYYDYGYPYEFNFYYRSRVR